MPQNEQSSMRQCVRWKRNGEIDFATLPRKSVKSLDSSGLPNPPCHVNRRSEGSSQQQIGQPATRSADNANLR
jgi:hypothetical protein